MVVLRRQRLAVRVSVDGWDNRSRQTAPRDDPVYAGGELRWVRRRAKYPVGAGNSVVGSCGGLVLVDEAVAAGESDHGAVRCWVGLHAVVGGGWRPLLE